MVSTRPASNLIKFYIQLLKLIKIGSTKLKTPSTELEVKGSPGGNQHNVAMVACEKKVSSQSFLIRV